MNWVTFALIGLTAVTVTIAVVAVTQANKKSDELKTQESSGAVLTNGYTVHDLSETSTLSNFESNGVQIARNGLVHFSAAEPNVDDPVYIGVVIFLFNAFSFQIQRRHFIDLSIQLLQT